METKDQKYTNWPEITPGWVREMRAIEAEPVPKVAPSVASSGTTGDAMLGSMFVVPASGEGRR